MMRTLLLFGLGAIGLIVASTSIFSSVRMEPAAREIATAVEPAVSQRGFEVEILVDGRPLAEYRARGRTYVEAIEGAEYEVQVRNPLPYRVAVALSVDGLNTIDARRTTAWNASKWVIEPYETISISGWQMSSARARRFYFTSERDSYGAKLGQTGNLGAISAVFFREVRSVAITPPSRPRPLYEGERGADDKAKSSAGTSSAGINNDSSVAQRRGQVAPLPDDEYAATGIGRSVRNDVRWINMELDSRPAAEVTIRYEYYPALVRLGIVPRPYDRRDSLRRREDATGFESRRYSPEP
ncbi:MAG: hypothetical protein ABR501_08820 [Pyrinomonadaceae bacterium]